MLSGSTCRIPPGVRAIFFDAVGTVIHPEPSAGDAYGVVGRRFGSRLLPAEVRRRFGLAFRRQEEEDLRRGLHTDEDREHQRWQRIVAEVLDDVSDRDGCFRALYDHFSRPTSWRCDPHAAAVVQALLARGYRVGLASNFDHRLRTVAGGLRELAGVSSLVISSEVGWKKPAPGFFSALCKQVELAPEQVLLVGDDPDNDLAGAIAAGLHALLLDPLAQSDVSPEKRIGSLDELIHWQHPTSPGKYYFGKEDGLNAGSS
jgi:putative hydrolase of the HAD superfamily